MTSFQRFGVSCAIFTNNISLVISTYYWLSIFSCLAVLGCLGLSLNSPWWSWDYLWIIPGLFMDDPVAIYGVSLHFPYFIPRLSLYYIWIIPVHSWILDLPWIVSDWPQIIPGFSRDYPWIVPRFYLDYPCSFFDYPWIYPESSLNYLRLASDYH